jgi:hypothetical protein
MKNNQGIFSNKIANLTILPQPLCLPYMSGLSITLFGKHHLGFLHQHQFSLNFDLKITIF